MTLRLAQSDPSPTPAERRHGRSDDRPDAAASPAPAPRGAQWITVDEAARRSGLNAGYIRHRCGQVWFAGGLARLERPEGGGKARWLIREDAAPELARVKGPDQIGTDLSHLTDAQRRQVADRKAVLDGWENALSARHSLGLTEVKATDQYLMIREARGHKVISRRTLFNWRNAFKSGGLAALADGRAASAAGGGSSPLADVIFERAKELWLTPRKWSVRRAYDLAMSELLASGRIQSFEDVEGGSYDSINRRLRAVPKAVVTLKREGKKAFTDKHEPYIERDYSGLDTNSVWCGDHHRFDVFVRVGTKPDGSHQYARPWLTAWQDLRSRRIVGYHLAATDPNTDTILAAFRKAAVEHGLPGEVMIDNGKDYDARALQGMTKTQRRKGGRGGATPPLSDDEARISGVFPILGVSVRHVQPYHGQSKPIERFFGTLAGRFSKLFETYCGHKPDARPEDLVRQLNVGAAPTLEDFARDFADWLRDDYDLRGHTGDAMDGRTPAEVFAACLVTKRVATAEQLHFACMPRFGPVTVSQAGVTFKGLHFGGFSAEVAGMFGRKVMLAVDNDDLSYVMLVGLDGRLLCRAPANHRSHVQETSQDLRAALAAKRATTRAVKDYHRVRTRITDDTRDAVLRAAQERVASAAASATPAGGEPLPPPTIAPVRTPFDDSIRNLATLRPAAGQEHAHSARAQSPAQTESYRLTAADVAAMAGPRRDDWDEEGDQ